MDHSEPGELEARLRIALESTTDSVFSLSADWRFTFLNRRAISQISGGRDLVGRNIREEFPEAVGGAFWRACHRCMAERVPTETEQFYPPLGRHFTARAFPAADGGVTVFFRDVTDERAVAARLADAEAMLRALGEASPDLLYAKDRQGRLRYANPAMLAVVGLPAERVIGRTDAEYIPDPAEAEALIRNDRRIMAQGTTEVVEEYVTDVRIGEPRLWQSTKTAIRDPASGEVTGLVGVARDITDARRAAAALAESEARYRSTFDHAAVGVAHVGLEGQWLRVNRRLCEMLGYTEAELLCRTFADVTHPDDVEADLSQGARLLAGEVDRFTTEKRYRRKDGTTVWANLTVALLRDQHGAAKHFISVVEDISARKSAEAALAAFFQASPLIMAILELRADGELIRVYDNPVASRFLSHMPGGTEGGTARQRGTAEDVVAIYRERCEDAQRRGTTVTFDIDRASAAGLRRLAVTIVPLGASGRSGGALFCFLAEDVTDRRAAEAALTESEARQRDFLRTLDLATVMVRDLDGAIRFWSAGCEHVYGWTAAEAVDRSVHDLLRTEFPVPLAEIEATLLREGEWSGDLRHRRRDGEEIVAAVRKVLRRDDAGAPVAVMESIADVTRLRRAETELRQLNETLMQRVREEVAAREQALGRLAQAERLEALGKLAGGIAHDFNNVLQAISSAANLIQRRVDDPVRVQELARMIADATGRGAAVTGRLLAFGRRGNLRSSAFAAGALLEDLREMLAPTLGAGIAVRVAVAAEAPQLLADRAQLETVLVNLAVNARDAMPQGGDLVISAAPESVRAGQPHPAGLDPGDYVRLDVTDTGVGMDAATLARASDPFFTTKPPGRGTGLGLAMARGFARQSGGAMLIRSVPGAGSTVSLWLPKAPPEDASAKAADPAAMGAGSVRERLLLVDDDPDVREALARELETIGYQVAVAADARSALARIDGGERPDALVTDFSMPEMNGMALIGEVRRRLPDLPAVLLTGYAGAAPPQDAALGTAATALLRKPVSGGELGTKLAALRGRVNR